MNIPEKIAVWLDGGTDRELVIWRDSADYGRWRAGLKPDGDTRLMLGRIGIGGTASEAVNNIQAVLD